MSNKAISEKDVVIEIQEPEEIWEEANEEFEIVEESVKEVDSVKVETEVYDFLKTSEQRWMEINLLINKTNEFSSEKDFYDVLCRSTTVLLVAQLEGYIKDLAKAVVRDLSDRVNFSIMPKIIKKNFISYFLGEGGRHEDLSKIFDKYNPELRIEPFLYDRNKNPSPNVIDKILGNFGIDSFFSYLHNSKLEIAFENNNEITDNLVEELKSHLLEGTKYFPYKVDLTVFDLKKSDVKFTKKNRSTSLWMTFLDDILQKRHRVAHGSNFDNELSDTALKEYERKSKILQYAIALVLIDTIVSNLIDE